MIVIKFRNGSGIQLLKLSSLEGTWPDMITMILAHNDHAEKSVFQGKNSKGGGPGGWAMITRLIMEGRGVKIAKILIM